MEKNSKYSLLSIPYECLVKYVYGVLENRTEKRAIETAIDNSEMNILEIISNIRVNMVIRKFETAQEHIETINKEISDIPTHNK